MSYRGEKIVCTRCGGDRDIDPQTGEADDCDICGFPGTPEGTPE